jgi:carbamoyltransferase
MRYILGINSAYHESAACLLRDGVIVTAVEEERLNRIKHAKQARVDNPDELPLRAIKECLKIAGTDLGRIDGIGFSINPRRRLKNKDFPDVVTESSWGSVDGEQQFFQKVSTVPEQLRELGFVGEFLWVDHHLCHAASAYYPSPFNETAVLTVDGIGEENSTAFGFGKGNDLRLFQEISYPSSLGFLWEKLCKYLGFSDYDACKVMALTAFGELDSQLEKFEELVQLLPDGKFRMNGDVLRFRVEDYRGLEELFGVRRRKKEEEIRPVHCNIIAALQRVTDKVMLHMCEYLHERTQSENLCLAGGVALNCVTNRYLHDYGPFQGLYIQPAAHDAGTAIGAASVVWHSRFSGVIRAVMGHAYLGPSYSDAEVKQELDIAGLTYDHEPEIERVAAELLSQGNIIGWFQGAMEFGPRALGNRSLLADPRNADMRQILNRRVKHRESFRPFAASALAEEVDKWFDVRRPTIASEFMLLTYSVLDGFGKRIPAVLHVDNTSRLQVVKKEVNPRYHALIEEFYRLTGVPLVLNTSFNDDEPIVCTVKDAIDTFSETRIDYLAIGNFLVDQKRQPKLRALAAEETVLEVSEVAPVG